MSQLVRLDDCSCGGREGDRLGGVPAGPTYQTPQDEDGEIHHAYVRCFRCGSTTPSVPVKGIPGATTFDGMVAAGKLWNGRKRRFPVPAGSFVRVSGCAVPFRVGESVATTTRPWTVSGEIVQIIRDMLDGRYEVEDFRGERFMCAKTQVDGSAPRVTGKEIALAYGAVLEPWPTATLRGPFTDLDLEGMPFEGR